VTRPRQPPGSRRLRTCACVAGLLLVGGPAAPRSPPDLIQTRARLLTPQDVLVEWSDPSRTAAGHVLEYVNEPTDEWVILGFFPRAQNSFKHARLAPQTPYRYRVRAFFGPASAPVEVTVAKDLSDRAYAKAYALPEDYAWAPPTKAAAAGAIAGKGSIRSPVTAAFAGPADFRAQLVASTVSGFQLTWRDRSSDEEGFLLERIESGGRFVVCATLEPDVTAFGWALEPPARKARFRLRAFYFGPASSVVSVTTGADPSEERAGDPRPRTRTWSRRP
jgi:hypothetical protein